MFKMLQEIERKCQELEDMRILAQAGEIMYRQKGELHTADRFRKAENRLFRAIRILKEQ
jgi:hypothetical protein